MSTVTSARGVEISGDFKYVTFRGKSYYLAKRYFRVIDWRLYLSDSECGPWEEAEEVKQ